jgi:hypothetical protein
MAPRLNRRCLVLIFYSTFAFILVLSWIANHNGNAGSFWTIEFTLLIGPILGGYFSRGRSLIGGAGLVEPFDGTKVLTYPKNTKRSYVSSLFHPEVDRDHGIRVDERSRQLRDAAHYSAFKSLGTLIWAAFLIDFCSESGAFSHEMAQIGLTPTVNSQIQRCVIQVGWLLVCTLPQAILLWNEPDIETEPVES